MGQGQSNRGYASYVVQNGPSGSQHPHQLRIPDIERPEQELSADEQEGALHRLLTPAVQDRWLMAAQHLAVAQNQIIMDGPWLFVEKCLNTSIRKQKQAPDSYQYCVQWACKNMFAFLMCLVFPLLVTQIYINSPVMTMQYDYREISDGFKNRYNYWRSSNTPDDYFLENVRVNVERLNRTLHNATLVAALQNKTALNDKSDHRLQEQIERVHDNKLLYLDDQFMQRHAGNLRVQVQIGVMACAIMVVAYALRVLPEFTWFAQCLPWLSRLLKGYFVFALLHSQWYTYDPRLKFADLTVGFGSIQLYKLIPCVWMSVIFCFVFVVPITSGYFNGDFDERICMEQIIPSMIAGYGVSKLYMSALSVTGSNWLYSEPSLLSVVVREFETGLADIYQKLADPYRSSSVVTVSMAEIEMLQSIKQLEMWLMQESLLRVEDPTAPKYAKDLKDKMMRGDWEKAGLTIQKYLHSNNNDYKQNWVKVAKANFIQSCLLQKVYICDTATDSTYVVDLAKETAIPLSIPCPIRTAYRLCPSTLSGVLCILTATDWMTAWDRLSTPVDKAYITSDRLLNGSRKADAPYTRAARTKGAIRS